MRFSLYTTALVLNSAPSVLGEIKFFNGPLPATSNYVQYSTSYLTDPGSVDLTYVTFTVDGPAGIYISDDNRYGGDDFSETDDMTDSQDRENDKDSASGSGDTDESTSGDTDESNSGDIDEANSGDTSEDTDEAASGDTSEAVSGDTSEDTSGDTSQDTSGDIDGATSGDTSQDTSGDIDEATSGDKGEATSGDTDEAAGGDFDEGAKWGNIDEPTSGDIDEPTSGDADEPTSGDTDEPTSGDADEPTSGDADEPTSGDIDDSNLKVTGNGNHTRHLAFKEFTIDILFFLEPSKCAKTKAGCDWTELGIGNSDGIGNLRWCCSPDALALGLCEGEQIGRLIVDAQKFKGDRRYVNVPVGGDFTGTVPIPVMPTHAGSGQYSLLLANCNDFGRDMQIEGKYIWKSKGGYLPGGLFDEWNFFIFHAIMYIVLFAWYGMSMKKNKESTIGIQKWILATIFISLVQTILETFDYAMWNADGLRSFRTMYTWISIGVIKNSISRCLLIMVCLGWGVIRDTLGDQMKKIVVLGGVYFVMAFCRDIAEVVFVKEIHVLSDASEEEIYDVFTLFTLITATIDVICYMWILDALNGTMQYLENMNQSMKLGRYLRLRLVLLVSILFGLFWTVMGIVDVSDTAILSENQNWVLPAAWSMNFFFILTSIAILWRPNPGAKEFAYVMELPSVGEDLDFETNVEMAETNGDEEGGAINHSYSGGLQGNESGMKIENAVSS